MQCLLALPSFAAGEGKRPYEEDDIESNGPVRCNGGLRLPRLSMLLPSHNDQQQRLRRGSSTGDDENNSMTSDPPVKFIDPQNATFEAMEPRTTRTSNRGVKDGISEPPVKYIDPHNIARTKKQWTKEQSRENRIEIVNAVNHLWDEDIHITMKALERVANLCWDCNKEDNEEMEHFNRMTFGRIGGPFAIVKAMERYRKKQDLLAESCRALQYAAYQNEFNQSLIAEVGGIAMIVGAMKKYSTNEYLQQCGCSALCNLVGNPENNEQVVDAGGIKILVKAMRRHSRNEEIQCTACWALTILSSEGEKMKRAIFDAGGLVAMSLAGQDHSFSAEVKDAVRGGLKALLS